MRFIADCRHSMAGCLSGAAEHRFYRQLEEFWGRPDLLKRDGLHPSWSGATLLSRNMAHSLRVRTWLTGAQVRKQTDWLNRPSANSNSLNSVNSTHSYKYGRTITSTTKDCIVSNVPDLSQFLSTSHSTGKLDDVTETMDSLSLALEIPSLLYA